MVGASLMPRKQQGWRAFSAMTTTSVLLAFMGKKMQGYLLKTTWRSISLPRLIRTWSRSTASPSAWQRPIGLSYPLQRACLNASATPWRP